MIRILLLGLLTTLSLQATPEDLSKALLPRTYTIPDFLASVAQTHPAPPAVTFPASIVSVDGVLALKESKWLKQMAQPNLTVKERLSPLCQETVDFTLVYDAPLPNYVIVSTGDGRVIVSDRQNSSLPQNTEQVKLPIYTSAYVNEAGKVIPSEVYYIEIQRPVTN